MHSDGMVGRRAWWSSQRRRYNILMIVAALISAVCLFAVWAIFEERLPCLEITGASLLFGAALFLIALGIANICYFVGPLSELVIRPETRRTFDVGVMVSVLRLRFS